MVYKFQIELADVPRGVYETLDFRVAQHPSEHPPYLLTRVLAYALNFQEGLAFSSSGLGDPDEAAIYGPDLIIEVGSASAKKLHKAAKRSNHVKVYNYKSPDRFMSELREVKIHRASEIQFYFFSPHFLDKLALELKKDNRWGVLVNESTVTVQIGERSFSAELLSVPY